MRKFYQGHGVWKLPMIPQAPPVKLRAMKKMVYRPQRARHTPIKKKPTTRKKMSGSLS